MMPIFFSLCSHSITLPILNTSVLFLKLQMAKKAFKLFSSLYKVSALTNMPSALCPVAVLTHSLAGVPVELALFHLLPVAAL